MQQMSSIWLVIFLIMSFALKSGLAMITYLALIRELRQIFPTALSHNLHFVAEIHGGNLIHFEPAAKLSNIQAPMKCGSSFNYTWTFYK